MGKLLVAINLKVEFARMEISARAIVFVIGFVLACVFVIFPCRVNSKKSAKAWILDYSNAPVLISVLLVCFTCIPWVVVIRGLLGKACPDWAVDPTSTSYLVPYTVVILFMALAYVCTSADHTKCFVYIANKFSKMALSSTNPNIVGLSLFTLLAGIFTLTTSNDIVVLTLTPIILQFAKKTDKRLLLSLLLAEFCSANSFSAGLLSGNPSNIILSSVFRIDFITYLKYLLVPAVLSGLCVYVYSVVMASKDTKEMKTAMPTTIASTTNNQGSMVDVELKVIVPMGGNGEEEVEKKNHDVNSANDVKDVKDVKETTNMSNEDQLHISNMGDSTVVSPDPSAIITHTNEWDSPVALSEKEMAMKETISNADAENKDNLKTVQENKQPIAGSVEDDNVPLTANGIWSLGILVFLFCLFLLSSSIQSRWPAVELWHISIVVLLITLVKDAVFYRSQPGKIWEITKALPWKVPLFLLSMFILVEGLSYYQFTKAIADGFARYVVTPVVKMGNLPVALLFNAITCLACIVFNNLPATIFITRIISETAVKEALGDKVMIATFSTAAGTNFGACILPHASLAGLMWSSLVKNPVVLKKVWLHGSLVCLILVICCSLMLTLFNNFLAYFCLFGTCIFSEEGIGSQFHKWN